MGPDDHEDRFTWHPGDVEMLPGPFWDASYEDGGNTILVQNGADLVEHLRQHWDGLDRSAALQAFLESPRSRLMPELIRRQLDAMGLLPYSPFAGYPNGGRALLGRPKIGDGTARHAYGRQVLAWCGYMCAYCDMDLGTFEGWLQLSIDHVVPQQMTGRGWPSEWLLDQMNIVACCMACNGLFNRHLATGDIPPTLEAFVVVRDAQFIGRRARIRERRAGERVFFDAQIAPGVAASRHGSA